MEVFEVTGSGAGNMGRVCVRHGTAGLEALTKSATTGQPGQDTTQPAAVCFSFVVAELFQKPSFHSTKEGGKKKEKPKASAHPSLDQLILQLEIT